jgi:nucleotide-binding universal stress UspA family protein
VLIPLSGSAFAEQAIKPALALGDAMGVEHTLLRVLSPTADSTLGRVHAGLPGTLLEEQAAEARIYFHRLRNRLETGARAVRIRIVRGQGSVASSILADAAQHEMDLIALTIQRRGALSRLARRGVTDDLLSKTRLPILAVASKFRVAS